MHESALTVHITYTIILRIEFDKVLFRLKVPNIDHNLQIMTGASKGVEHIVMEN